MIKYSIIIPVYGRSSGLDRSIASVKVLSGYEYTEIIVVDDASPVPIKPAGLRKQDKLLRNERNSGAAVSRNNGIRIAKGKIIYLLDSDDYFIERNFSNDLSEIEKNPHDLFFCQVQSQGSSSVFPMKITKKNYFDFILKVHPHITQTSSLVFSARNKTYFDESLPKHQDWDFVWSNYLCCGKSVNKLSGIVFFDRSDKNSISRTMNVGKSLPFIDKISDKSFYSAGDKSIETFRLIFLSSDKKFFPTTTFLFCLTKSLIMNKISLKRALIITYRRFFK